MDLATHQVSTIPGSENLFSPRWSPDGQYLAALTADSTKLLLFNFKTQKWSDWVNEPGAIGFPNWSRDGSYLYYDNTFHRPSHVSAGQGRPKPLGAVSRFERPASLLQHRSRCLERHRSRRLCPLRPRPRVPTKFTLSTWNCHSLQPDVGSHHSTQRRYGDSTRVTGYSYLTR